MSQQGAIDFAAMSPGYFPAELPFHAAPNSIPMAMSEPAQNSGPAARSVRVAGQTVGRGRRDDEHLAHQEFWTQVRRPEKPSRRESWKKVRKLGRIIRERVAHEPPRKTLRVWNEVCE